MADAGTMQVNHARRTPVSKALRQRIKKLLRIGPAAVGAVRWGDLRRTSSIGGGWGFERGTPVDRDYIEDFLRERASDIAGHVLEVKDAAYTRQFGGERVTESAVLDVDPQNPDATIVTDLNHAVELP